MAEHRRGANLPAIGGFNRTVVLDAIRRSTDGLSRVELADRTGLSPQTVSNVTRHLIDAGMVVESGTVVAGRGKPRTILRLEPTSRYAVGVHVDPAVVTSVLLDLTGAVVAGASVPTPSAANPDDVVSTMADAVERLVTDAGVDRAAVLGVGVASPGPIDPERGVVLDPPFLPRWRDVPVRDALAAATGLPVLLEKDVTAAAVGEMWLTDEASAWNFAFVYYGTGFGVGLVIDHEPLRGSGGNAGDAGHIMIDQGLLAELPEGPAARRMSDRGSRGVGTAPVTTRATRSGEGRAEVGDTVTPERLVRFGAAAGLDIGAPWATGDGPTDVAAVDAAFSELSALVAEGDPIARAIAAAAGTAMGRAVVVIVNLLDVDRVVFGGPFWSRIAVEALPAAAQAIASSPVLVAKHPVVVEQSEIDEDVTAVGAACLVLDTTLSPRASTLLIDR
ncbi:ROK family transcriptional regulator [Curtobacterium sp. MCBD17_034]|uniref:ROK family transcriptional regulator n=1 Tax=unclassified Curtobacterium TaxID=257496 RepID=UPI000DAAD186|nr:MULTISPECIES: ROK family transcriptional regulator [unclassified Curtobacterium]PZF62360.1 ROK family transcriptional regulator [Curtobacterium sp. MCBD17_034]PZM39933.1 ROK family transcriptional regulator [Curtobacterium sp. MCBD17_031]